MNETGQNVTTELSSISDVMTSTSREDDLITTPSDEPSLSTQGGGPPSSANELHVEDMTMRLIYYGVGTVGIIGNLLVIVVFLSSPQIRRKITNMLIIHQSILDMTASMFLVLCTLFDEMSWVSKGLASELFCRYTYIIYSRLYISSIFLIT